MTTTLKRSISSGSAGMFSILISSRPVLAPPFTYYSETYTSRIQMYDIGVSLVENDKEISWAAGMFSILISSRPVLAPPFTIFP